MSYRKRNSWWEIKSCQKLTLPWFELPRRYHGNPRRVQFLVLVSLNSHRLSYIYVFTFYVFFAVRLLLPFSVVHSQCSYYSLLYIFPAPRQTYNTVHLWHAPTDFRFSTWHRALLTGRERRSGQVCDTITKRWVRVNWHDDINRIGRKWDEIWGPF